MNTTEILFDPFSEDFFNGAWETYRRMRDDAPVYYNCEHDFYALTRHADVASAYKDFTTYSSARGTDLAAVRNGNPVDTTLRMIIMMDPPGHRDIRSLLNKVFTPRAIEAQKQTVIEKIDKYLGRVDPQGFDAIDDFTGPFPVEIITAMMGAPDEDAQQVRRWIDASLTREIGQFELTEEGVQASIDTAMYYYGLVEQRRAASKDDLLSRLLAAELVRDDGEKTQMTDLEIAAFASLLGGAGAETVTKLVGNAIYLFAKHPEQWQALLADRSKIPTAVEELLRYAPPVHYNMRVATKDVYLHGETIPEGAPVFLIGASANRDNLAWTNPDTFDTDRNRTQAQNLGFGYGIHSCLGAALARMESAIALDKLLDFMPRYEVDFDRCQRVQMANVVGWKTIPVRVIR